VEACHITGLGQIDRGSIKRLIEPLLMGEHGQSLVIRCSPTTNGHIGGLFFDDVIQAGCTATPAEFYLVRP
jgi:hypothetical protein